MILRKEIEIPIYRGYFIVMFADHEAKVGDYYDDLGERCEITYACYCPVNHNKRQSFLIGFNTENQYAKITHGTIAHEIHHATTHLLLDRGMKLDDGSDEAFAYLIDWMTGIVYNLIEEWGIKIHLDRNAT